MWFCPWDCSNHKGKVDKDCCREAYDSPKTLSHLGADPDTVTVSGHSAGCYMADQMHMIHSESIHGAVLL